MSKWFECRLEIWKTVLVEVNDDETSDDASQAAFQEFMGGFDGEVSGVIEIGADQLASHRRHADEILSL
jgi:hypothetical protein